MVQDWISISLCTSCENNDIEMLAQSLQHLFAMWPNLNITETNASLERSKRHFNLEVWSGSFICVDQCLIHIKHDSFPI